jgi:DNA invertase Pin-like site-specific DNA recombinase
MEPHRRAVEVESGKVDRRPQLEAALAHCELTGATLIVAKLDRLSRNVAFLAALQDSDSKFIAVDLPEANELTIHIMAAVAQAERKAISMRTKEALAAAEHHRRESSRTLARTRASRGTGAHNDRCLRPARPTSHRASLRVSKTISAH